MEIICNKCWQPAQEKAFKTACNHVFCETCVHHQYPKNLGCPVCSKQAASVSEIREFQVVGGPIPENQLESLQDMIVAVYVANGHRWFSNQIDILHRFELVQMEARIHLQEVEKENSRGEWAKREEAFMNQQIQTQHVIDKLEHKCDQLQKNLSDLSVAKEKLVHALEDKTRQMANWKQMYEDLRSGEPQEEKHEFSTQYTSRAEATSMPRTQPINNERSIHQDKRNAVESNFQPFVGVGSFLDSSKMRKFTTCSGYHSDTAMINPSYRHNLFKDRPRSNAGVDMTYKDGPFHKRSMELFTKRPPTSYGSKARSKKIESNRALRSPMSTGSRNSGSYLREILNRTPSMQRMLHKAPPGNESYDTFKRRHV